MEWTWCYPCKCLSEGLDTAVEIILGRLGTGCCCWGHPVKSKWASEIIVLWACCWSEGSEPELHSTEAPGVVGQVVTEPLTSLGEPPKHHNHSPQNGWRGTKSLKEGSEYFYAHPSTNFSAMSTVQEKSKSKKIISKDKGPESLTYSWGYHIPLPPFYYRWKIIRPIRLFFFFFWRLGESDMLSV